MALRLPTDRDVQADIGRAAVQAVIIGDRDLKRRLLAEPQRAAEADHDARLGGEWHHIRCAIGARNGHRAAPLGSDG